MATRAAAPASPAAARLAREAWRLLHLDSARSRRLAERALAAAGSDVLAEGWAHLVCGVHGLYYATATEAAVSLRAAQRCFERGGDRPGQILAQAAIARSMWRQGLFREALAKALPVRDEGARALRHEQRGVLLNTIAGCYSALGDSAQAFAYMFEALRHAGPRSGRGFDTVLHCNLSHELLQIGDHEQALRHVEEGLARSQGLKNNRLLAVLWINRVISLTELGRAGEALRDVQALLALPRDDSGRGRIASDHESLAIAALRAGDVALGADLIARAEAEGPASLPDERFERACAHALLHLARGRARDAVAALAPLGSEAASDRVDGLSLRIRAQYFEVLAEAEQRARRSTAALAALREWQRLHRVQAQLASRARYQAAALQTELLRLQHNLDEKDAERRATERARSAVFAANAELERRVAQVQALQQELRDQATRDALTGLFNRRHLNDTVPQMVALARRERQPLAVAIIDLDHFKLVNDHHGHAAGDALLAAFGELLAASSRRSDVACRYGGEEFCLLMPRTTAEGARRKVAALLRRWRSTEVRCEGGLLPAQTFSAGVADTELSGCAVEALLKRADDELLLAKQQGRNRVRVAVLDGVA
jgi:two-component system, cell cycle response regulator